MARAEGGLLLLDEPGEPLGVYLRSVLTAQGALGDGTAGAVLPRLTGETVCQVYAGVCLDHTPRQVLETLFARRRVWVPWEGLDLPQGGPLGALVRERLFLLRRSGLTLCPLGRLAQLAAGEDGRGMGYGIGPGARLGVVQQKIR